MLSAVALFVLAGLPGQITNAPAVTQVANSWCRRDADCRVWFDYDAKCNIAAGTCTCGDGYNGIRIDATSTIPVCTGPDVTDFLTDATVELVFTNAPNTACRMTAAQVVIFQRIVEALFTPTTALSGQTTVNTPRLLIQEKCAPNAATPAVNRFFVTVRVLGTQALTAARQTMATFNAQYNLVANVALRNSLGLLITYGKMYGEDPCYIEGGAKTGFVNGICNAFTCQAGYTTYSTNPSFPRIADTLCTIGFNTTIINTVNESDDELTTAGAVVAGVLGAIVLGLFALFVICKALNPPTLKQRIAEMEETNRTM